MKIINLVYPEKSEISYKISKFPDGQQDITINFKPVIPTNNSLLVENVIIKSRFNSFKDLELIIATTAALRRIGVKEIHLYIPYLLGARSDRHFVEGGNSYLVDVVAPIINAQDFESVRVMDAHSDVAAAVIKNLKAISLVDFYKGYFDDKNSDDIALVSPDGGSLKKIYKVAEQIYYKGEVIVCSKYRDTDGKLSKTHVPVNSDDMDKTAVIIDDICDGGRTFINIAEQLKLNNWRGKIVLIVTHGIFSAGFDGLSKYFDHIYCTNSIHDFSPFSEDEVLSEEFFLQYNVF